MKVGVSTASLYPLHIEDAFYELANRDIENVELFLNSTTEQSGEPMKKILAVQKEYGINITSLHPFSSPMESVYLFSSYDRRINEMLELYKSFFNTMNTLGADIFVLHGAMQSSHCSDEHYFNQLHILAQLAKSFGITVAQENISYCKSKSVDFLRKMKSELGDEAKLVCDLKQARRSGIDVLDFIEEFGSDIIHYHISDCTAEHDCLPIGAGVFDFKRFLSKLKALNYDGALIVELYRENYNEYDELKTSVVSTKQYIDSAK